MTLQDAQAALCRLIQAETDPAMLTRYRVELRAHDLVAMGEPTHPVDYRPELLAIHRRAIKDALARADIGETVLEPVQVAYFLRGGA